MELSIGEILIVILVIVIFFGPKKIPEIARELGQGIRHLKGTVEDIKQDIMKQTDNPVSEIKKEIENLKSRVLEKSPLEEPKQEVDEIKKDINPLDDDHKGPISR